MKRGGWLERLHFDVRGSTAVELALTMPVLASMLLGAVWAGSLAFTANSLTHAVQKAARCAAVNGVLCSTASDVEAFAAAQYAGANISPVFTSSTLGCGHTVTAQATFNVDVVPGIPSVPLSASACYP